MECFIQIMSLLRLHGEHCSYQHLLGWRWGKQHWICFLVLYVWVIAIQPLATHIMDVGRKSNAEVGILYICSLKMTKMHFRDHFPTVGEIEK